MGETRTYTVPSDGVGNTITTSGSTDAGVPMGLLLLLTYSGVGTVSVTGTPKLRKYIVDAESRSWTIPAESRTYTVRVTT
jgi:hypothetical protein